MPVSTADCKNAIIDFFNDHPNYITDSTASKDLKRVSKTKNSDGNVVRRFTHLNRDIGEEDFYPVLSVENPVIYDGDEYELN